MKYIEYLESVNKKMIVKEKGLKITQDAILLSEFIKKYFEANYKNIKEKKNFLEVGAGQGIISLLLSEMNAVSKIFPINKNIKNIQKEYDFIFSNPPYKKTNSGKMPEDKSEKISKYEILLTLEELFQEIKRLLKNYGEFFVIVPNNRLNDVFRYIYKNNMNILTIEVNKYKKTDLVVVHGRKGGKINSGIEINV